MTDVVKHLKLNGKQRRALGRQVMEARVLREAAEIVLRRWQERSGPDCQNDNSNRF